MKKIIISLLAITSYNLYAFNWSELNSGTIRDLKAIEIIDANTAIAVGDSILIKTIDGGNSWNELTFPFNQTGKLIFEKVHFDNAFEGYILGSLRYPNWNNTWYHYVNALFITIDGGNTWVDKTPNTLDERDHFVDFHFFESDEALAFTSRSASVTSDNIGDSWTNLPDWYSSFDMRAYDMEILNNETWLLSGGFHWGYTYTTNNAGIKLTKDKGNSYSIYFIENAHEDFIDIEILNDTTVLALSGYTVSELNLNLLDSMVPDNYGYYNELTTENAIKQLTTTALHSNDLLIVNDSNYALAGSDGQVMVTLDGGDTWSTEITNISAALHQIKFWNNGYIAIGNGGTIIVSGFEARIKESDPKSNIKLFPNPALHTINISNPDGLMDHLTITDISGKVILKQENIQKQHVTFEISHLNSGFYTAIVGSESELHREVIIKE